MSKNILAPLRQMHRRWFAFRTVALPVILRRIRNPKAAFLVLTPEHGNLGDHAIAHAETLLLSRMGIPYIELTGSDLVRLQEHRFLGVMNGRPIFINGGGNLGTLWFDVEQLTREIITANRNSSIRILPNTIYYEDSEWGKEEQARSVQLYGAHPNLRLYAREAVSYEQMKGLYKNVKLVPDMVLSLSECRSDAVRHGCLLCLREDLEKTRSAREDAALLRQAKAIFGEDVQYTDMCVEGKVPVDARSEALARKFDEFRGASLVITDRLHGMLFCAVTGTPCIVVNSKSPKVKGCYEWISNLNYIRFAEDVSVIEQLWKEIPCEEHSYDPAPLRWYFEELAEDLVKAYSRTVADPPV